MFSLTRGASNLCETASPITPSSTYGIKFFGMPVLGSSYVHMEAKVELNMEYLENDLIIYQNPERLLNTS